MVAFSLEETTDTGEALGANEMGLLMSVAGRSGRDARRLTATCEETNGTFECVVARDKGRFILAPQGDNVHLTVNEINLPGDDSNRQGLLRLLSERGEDQGFVLARVEPELCL